MFSSEHSSARTRPSRIRVTWGSRQLADAGIRAPRTMRCAAPVRTISGLPGALIARSGPSLSEVIARGGGPEQPVEILDADSDEPHAEP